MMQSSFKRKVTLFLLGAISGYVAHKAWSKRKQRDELNKEYALIMKNYLKELQQNESDHKALTAKCKKKIYKFEAQSETAMHLSCRIMAYPPNNELGELMIETMFEWNKAAYQSMINCIFEMTAAQKKKLRFLEIGCGGGYGIEVILKKFGTKRLEFIHAFETSEKCISALNTKFAEHIDSNKIEIKYANIGHKDDRVILDTIMQNVGYDVIFHLNSFYFWDNLKVCSYHLRRLSAPEGCIVGGFRWNGLADLDKDIYKHRQQSIYIDMLKDMNCIGMDRLKINDCVDGDKNFQIITAAHNH